MHYTTNRPLGANWDTRPIYVYTPNYAWVKYAVTCAVAIALRFLCCG